MFIRPVQRQHVGACGDFCKLFSFKKNLYQSVMLKIRVRIKQVLWVIVLISPMIASVSVKDHKADAENTNSILRVGIDQNQSKVFIDEKENSAGFYAQSSDRWLKPQETSLWSKIHEVLIEMIVYVPVFGLLGFIYWNHTLKQEIRRRQRAESLLKVAVEGGELVCWEYLPETGKMKTFGYFRGEDCEPISRELTTEEKFSEVDPQDLPRVKTAFTNCEQFGEINLEYRKFLPNGEVIWLLVLGKLFVDQSTKTKRVLGVSLNITSRVQMEEQLRYEAFHDQLTGLPNRKLLEQRLQQLLNHCQTVPHTQFAVLFLDLDQFKLINDSLGHIAGDGLLIKVATLLTQLIEKTHFIARIGGDEFVILLEEIPNMESAKKLTKKILAGFRSSFKIEEREIFMRTSIGVVIGTCGNYQQPEAILRDADIAMYHAKHSGGNGYALFNSKMHQLTVERLHLENDLHQALERDEFVLYYQPIVCLETGQVKSFEALIRWQHPQKGLLSPNTFITIAEETQLITGIGQWTLNSACEQLARWRTQFPDRDLKLAVNLSVQQMQDPLLEQLDELLKTYALPRESLVLEITESMLMENVENTHRFLDQIKAKGVMLTVDDFGTGYSCLNYLHQLPIDGLKIDRSFISAASSDSKQQVIAQSIMALCHSLKLKAIAEGIETLEQLQWLYGLGCPFGQGYLFSPPLPRDRAEEIMISTFQTVS